ncbi:cobalamin biosynthesis protein [Actinoplanes sp. NPDC020271]|uniref:cobalamin biosynthesis protein n=1 Tax=Actinoplanes sp. NPDC020271 TaxID=3363896 RepID=UPI0037AC8754
MIAVGVGARAGVGPAVLVAAVEAALAEAAVGRARVSTVATLDRRAAEAGFRLMAEGFGWGLVAFTAAELAEAVAGSAGTAASLGGGGAGLGAGDAGPAGGAAGPAGGAAGREPVVLSGRVAAAVGTPSVAEAAALLAAGAGTVLILPKRILGGVTVAIAGSAES